MKKGYSVENEINYEDRFIIVSNLKIDNKVINYGVCDFRASYIESFDVGVWKIKNKN